MLASFENILDSFGSSRNKIENQVSMFDLFESKEENGSGDFGCNYTECEELEMKEFLSFEKEMLGIYLSGHPLDKFRKKIEAITNINSLDLVDIDNQLEETGKCESFQDGQTIKIAGIISKVKKKITRNNSLMAFVTLDDLYGSYEVIVFESIFNRYGIDIEEEKIVLVER